MLSKFWFRRILVSLTPLFVLWSEECSSPMTSIPAVLLVFCAGRFLLAQPVICFLFGYLNIWSLAEYPLDSVYIIWEKINSQSYSGIFWTLVAGILDTFFWGTYFYGSTGDIPASIAFALLNSYIPMSVLLSVFVWGEHAGDNYCIPYTLMFVGFVFFGPAYYILFDYSLLNTTGYCTVQKTFAIRHNDITMTKLNTQHREGTIGRWISSTKPTNTRNSKGFNYDIL